MSGSLAGANSYMLSGRHWGTEMTAQKEEVVWQTIYEMAQSGHYANWLAIACALATESSLVLVNSRTKKHPRASGPNMR